MFKTNTRGIFRTRTEKAYGYSLLTSGMERRRTEEETRKGPWTAEEDEILINFVKANGPRDWSSIRSKGLLPRTGKSCRLRWVNKLRPNLKKGCKFSAEEERLVLDLQATFGNRWATIASYLPGRTDNDVKNFWSTRQKRLARILRSSSQSSSSQKNKSKILVDDETSSSHQSQVSKSCSNEANKASFPCMLCSCFCTDNFNGFTMLPPQDCLNPCTIEVNTTGLPLPADVQPGYNSPFGLPETDSKPPTASSLHVSLSQHPQQTVDFPFLQESHEYFSTQFAEPSTMNTCQETIELGNIPQLDLGLSMEEVDPNSSAQDYNERDNYQDKIPVLDNTFNDLPADLFEYLEKVP